MPPLILSDKAHITQGDLPHWDDKKAIYFATFRLADSLPITAMKEFRAWEEDKLESLNHGNVATTAWEEFERERQDLIEKLSDKGHGACILQRPNIRQVVGDTLLHYDEQGLLQSALSSMNSFCLSLHRRKRNRPAYQAVDICHLAVLLYHKALYTDSVVFLVAAVS